MTSSEDWQAVLGAPRHANRDLDQSDIPKAPGVYAWFQDGECVYIGMATNLHQRLGSHRRRSLDLSRSTLRATVAVTELGVTRKHARSRLSIMTDEQIAVVNRWFERAEVTWVECDTKADADALERRLRSDWLPTLNLM